jgi:hypothetical protein
MAVIVYVHLKEISPNPPTTLRHFNANVWQQFTGRMMPISRRMKQLNYFSFTAATLSWVALGLASALGFGIVIPGLVFFIGFFSFVYIMAKRRKIKAFDDEVNGICTDFLPQFQSEGYKLEYVPKDGVVVLTRISDLVQP